MATGFPVKRILTIVILELRLFGLYSFVVLQFSGTRLVAGDDALHREGPNAAQCPCRQATVFRKTHVTWHAQRTDFFLFVRCNVTAVL